MAHPGGVWPAVDDVVAVAWLKRVNGIEPGQVATTLPKDVATWTDAGFLQASTIPGGRLVEVDRYRLPVVQLDAWGAQATANSSSIKPQWGLANRLIELVRIATEEAQDGHYGETLDLGPEFAPVRVQAVYMIGGPSRVTDDPANYARYTADLAVDWVRI